MVFLIPNDATIITVQPIIPIKLIKVLDLCRMTSRIFHLVPNENLFQSFVFSIARFLTFFGEYGCNVSAAVPLSIFLTDKNPIRVNAARSNARTSQQNHGGYNVQLGISKYVLIVPFGFIIMYAIRYPSPMPTDMPTTPIKNA